MHARVRIYTCTHALRIVRHPPSTCTHTHTNTHTRAHTHTHTHTTSFAAPEVVEGVVLEPSSTQRSQGGGSTGSSLVSDKPFSTADDGDWAALKRSRFFRCAALVLARVRPRACACVCVRVYVHASLHACSHIHVGCERGPPRRHACEAQNQSALAVRHRCQHVACGNCGNRKPCLTFRLPLASRQLNMAPHTLCKCHIRRVCDMYTQTHSHTHAHEHSNTATPSTPHTPLNSLAPGCASVMPRPSCQSWRPAYPPTSSAPWRPWCPR
jgi:hypothetical protein